LDLSFNYLKDLKPFKDIQGNQLTYINLSFNFLTSLENLGSNFPTLKTIDANANRI
jgi:Leucine-rich repeat (LRR) protein